MKACVRADCHKKGQHVQVEVVEELKILWAEEKYMTTRALTRFGMVNNVT